MKLKNIDLLEYFSSEEGINLRYGRPGHGKTSTASVEIVQRLRRGSVEYANWKITVKDYNEMDSKMNIVLWFLGLKKEFLIIKASKNLHYFELDDEWARKQSTDEQKYEDFNDWFASRTDCVFNIDEGHLLLDSYIMAKQSLKQRATVLHTRHFSRTINIISQRPTAVHVTARGNVETFIKCQQILPRRIRKWVLGAFGWTFIRVIGYQDMIGDTVDEESDPEWVSYHWLKRTNTIYDSKYLRRGLKASQVPEIEIWQTERGDRWGMTKVLVSRLLGRYGGFSRRTPILSNQQTTNTRLDNYHT